MLDDVHVEHTGRAPDAACVRWPGDDYLLDLLEGGDVQRDAVVVELYGARPRRPHLAKGGVNKVVDAQRVAWTRSAPELLSLTLGD
jgi:hypothetical protein